MIIMLRSSSKVLLEPHIAYQDVGRYVGYARFTPQFVILVQ